MELKADAFKTKDFIFAGLLFVVMIVSRMMPHPWNFTALGAGSFLLPVVLLRSNLKVPGVVAVVLAMMISLSALFISDLFLGFYSGMVFVYAATLLCVILGFLFQELLADVFDGREFTLSMMKAGSGQMLGSLLFFVLTNFSIWFHSGMYSKNLDGFLTCYAMALPFLKWQLLGDLFYFSLLVGGYKLTQVIPRLVEKTHS